MRLHTSPACFRGPLVSKIATKIVPKTETRVQRPRLHKVILFNDDYTPRDFVVEVLKAVRTAERMDEPRAPFGAGAPRPQDDGRTSRSQGVEDTARRNGPACARGFRWD